MKSYQTMLPMVLTLFACFGAERDEPSEPEEVSAIKTLDSPSITQRARKKSAPRPTRKILNKRDGKRVEGRWEEATKRGRRLGHVTDVTVSGEVVAATTFGRGLMLSRDGGELWLRVARHWKRDGVGLVTNYLNGVDVVGETVWVRSVGDGFGAMALEDKSWRWWGGEAFGGEHRFPRAFFRGGADLLLMLTTDGFLRSEDNGRRWKVWARPKQERVSYLDSYQVLKREHGLRLVGEWYGHLNGLVHVKPSGRVEHIDARSLSSGRAREIVAAGLRLFVRGEEGLGMSVDGGQSWVPVDGLPDQHVRAMLLDGERLWIGTARGLVALSVMRQRVLGVIRNGSEPRYNQINAIEKAGPNQLWVGTPEGLWKVTVSEEDPVGDGPHKPETVSPCEPSGEQRYLEGVPSWGRPLETGNDLVDQTYPFGSTWGGQFSVHKGADFNTPTGSLVVSVAEGEIVFADPRPDGSRVIVVKHDAPYQGRVVYSLYGHLMRMDVDRGQRVKAGERLGASGRTGTATNEHLHFEIRLGRGSKKENPFTLRAYNGAIFLKPAEGRGSIAGRVTGLGHGDMVQVSGPLAPDPQESPFDVAMTYGKGAWGLPDHNENFFITDVPAGIYPIEVNIAGRTRRQCVRILPGQIAWVVLK